MAILVEPVARLVDQFSRLPGVGPKTAQRLTYFLLRAPAEQSQELADALVQMKERVTFCSICFNITEQDPCELCSSPSRDRSLLCVVEEPLDVLAIERTHEFRGLYHVLHGALSPMEGIFPDDLRIDPLVRRLRDAAVGEQPVEEIILATNPKVEGDATAMYIARLIAPLNIRLTRLARGLPIGSDLEYADEGTLTRAIQGRREF
jgi:recombination protein RecR